MSQITTIKLEHKINYSRDELEYFISENKDSMLLDYNEIIDNIKNAKSNIKIASTSKLNNNIFDAIHQNKSIRKYIILKSFDDSQTTVDGFSSKHPAILREVESLENNFIIIDSISYFFINPLSYDQNIYSQLDETYTKDLDYIFNYYFWDNSNREKILNEVSKPKESPFPAIEKRKLKLVNIKDSSLEKCQKLYIPRNKKNIDLLDIKTEKSYFSDDLYCPVYLNGNSIKIGSMEIDNQRLDIGERWALKNKILDDIDTDSDIFPKSDSWDKSINIKETKDIHLDDVEAKTIEDMKITQPNDFRQEKYVKEITFKWKVIPPKKPNDAIKSNLYNQYKELDISFKNQLNELESILKNVEKESSLLKWFSGTTRKAKENIKKIEEYRQKDLFKLAIKDIDDLIKIEFKEFYEKIIKNESNFKEERKEKEAKEEWDKQKKQKTKTLKNKKDELEKYENKLTPLMEKTKDKSRLERDIKKIKSDIENKELELKNKYNQFNYKAKPNEIANLKNDKKKEIKELMIPKYQLPEIGVLYENKNSYFLEISSYDEQQKANEISKRYTDKENYKVVVIGDSNE